MEDTPPPPAPDEVIVCRVTPWFYRRMGILGGMLLFMGLYFLYDGKIGYRKENAIAAEKARFEELHLPAFDRFKGEPEKWRAYAHEQNIPEGVNGEPPKWATYAAARGGWPENPKVHSEEEIFQQFEWGGAMLLLALVVGVKVLVDRRKVLLGHPERMVMPGGEEVRFAEVFKVDKRKWDHKGLAYVHHRGGGRERRATVDDLKFGGAGRVLERLLSRFQGELIEKIPDPEDAADVPPEEAAKD